MAKDSAQVKDALELVKLRNQFYRDNYRRMVLVVLMLTLVNVLLGLALSYYITHRDEPNFFATTPSGDIVRLVPLRQPLVSRTALLSWAEESVTATFTYDFVNYQGQLQELRDRFTAVGWQNFIHALGSSDFFNTVKAKQLSVSAIPSGPAVINQEGYIRDIYTWKIQVPMQVSFESASERKVDRVIVELLVKRVSTLQNQKGLGIEQYIATASTGGRGAPGTASA